MPKLPHLPPAQTLKIRRRAKPAAPASSSEFDHPLPAWIAPCLPTLVGKPPVGAHWVHEIKWDGYRVSAYLADGKAAIYTRNGHDWTHRFPGITAAVAALPIHSAVIDGEAVALDENGHASFALLQAALGTGGRGPGKRQAAEAVLYAFDLLFLDGHDLRGWSLANRRDALESIAAPAAPTILFSQSFHVSGADLFASASELGLEGIVSKQSDLPYSSGRRADWLKTKCVQDGTFVVIGYQPSTATKTALGAVHVAEEAGGELRYVGAVGSGFSHQAAAAMQKRLDALGKPTPSVMGLKINGALWSKPELRVDVNYRATTREGMLRHASFKGVREG